MKTLIEIYEEAVAKGACKSQIVPFKKFIDAGEEDKAWSTALGSWEWLQYNNIVTIEELETKTNTALSWHDNGRLWEKGVYENGEKTGLWEYYYENGNKVFETNFS